ncbi:MAG TPA: DEAD/DEAH box helicase [Stellaceae bacterium]|nr:DEAD/DEAH box helicase [Stellaceae bacterium]
MSFEDLGLSAEVLKAVGDAGYTAPTPIQEQAIPYVLMGRDVLGCAQTGTGKTASFTLPMIDVLAAGRARARMPRSLIIEPTRELAAQVAEAFDVYGKYHKLEQALLIGGESFTDQQRKLDRGVDVLIATPGRLLDLYERGKILLSDVKILVIDEADRMLDMGFIPDVERIVGLLSKIRQTLFFSATMPPEIRRLADAFLMNPKEISVAPPASPATLVTQGLVVVTPAGKRDALRRLIRNEDVKNAIIFCNRKRDVDVLQRSLSKHGFDAAALHGDMPQSKRTETLDRFRAGEIRLLVASDVAARGLDVQGMSHVFNFDVPIHAEDYVHRIGRTGRAGREGRAFTLAAPEDGRYVDAIQHLIGKAIPPVDIPGVETEALVADEDAPRDRRGGRGRGRSRTKPEARSPSPRHEETARHEERPHAAKPPREAPEGKREPRREPKREHARPAAKEPAFAPITMKPADIDQPVEFGGNVTKLPRRDEPHHRDHDHDDDRRVVGFGDHMPAFLGRARGTRSL